jgi:antitoxin (DNA-binding transcriptional repressor) of toxin-antitoxin stability system
MSLFALSKLVRKAPDVCLDEALAALPEQAFRLRARDAAIALPNGWRATFAWEGERDKACATEPDSITITLHGVPVLRLVDLRRRAPYPTHWTVTKRPTTPTLTRAAAQAVAVLTACVRTPAPGFHPTFARPDWDSLA